MSIVKLFGVSEFRSLIKLILDEMDFFPIFRTSIAVPETFPILSNLSSHGPGMLAISY